MSEHPNRKLSKLMSISNLYHINLTNMYKKSIDNLKMSFNKASFNKNNESFVSHQSAIGREKLAKIYTIVNIFYYLIFLINYFFCCWLINKYFLDEKTKLNYDFSSILNDIEKNYNRLLLFLITTSLYPFVIYLLAFFITSLSYLCTYYKRNRSSVLTEESNNEQKDNSISEIDNSESIGSYINRTRDGNKIINHRNSIYCQMYNKCTYILFMIINFIFIIYGFYILRSLSNYVEYDTFIMNLYLIVRVIFSLLFLILALFIRVVIEGDLEERKIMLDDNFISQAEKEINDANLVSGIVKPSNNIISLNHMFNKQNIFKDNSQDNSMSVDSINAIGSSDKAYNNDIHNNEKIRQDEFEDTKRKMQSMYSQKKVNDNLFRSNTALEKIESHKRVFNINRTNTSNNISNGHDNKIDRMFNAEQYSNRENVIEEQNFSEKDSI